MAVVNITRTLLQKLPPLPQGVAKLRIFDDRLNGFFAEQRATCVTFYIRYVDTRRRRHEHRIGKLGDITLDQARKRAEQIRAEVSLGRDPAGELAKLRAVPTVAEFVSDRYLPHVQERLRSASNVEVYFRLRILPALGRKALDEVTPQDVAELRRKLIADGLANGTCNRHLAYVRAMFNQAREWQVIECRNPAASPGMLREVHRDKYLSPAETRALVKALDADKDQTAASALALLIVTGARRGEAMEARWENVNLDLGVLTVPLAKSGRTRHVPLAPAAVAILQRQLTRRQANNPHVFPSGVRQGEPVEGLRGVWARAKKAAGLAPDLRVHDLRHSFASVLANEGIPLNEIGVLLGHTQISTTQRYAHHAPQRLIATAATASRAWNLLPEPEEQSAA